ncbi:MAG TPA: extracellular solute-binding protein [Acetobacteraceae bacterium]|jgi:iron(III) transport system substrate-binding protein|nr:extracellular solute-binding protein [Acetobacteraceae bacterium]
MRRRPFAALSAILVALLGAVAAVACDNPRQMDGFKTCADVAKAEQEGALVVYSTDPEAAAEAELAKFHAVFPKIRMNYLRIQAGGLYAKLLAERQGNVYLADIAQLSDVSFALDFQKRGGYMQYVSPEMAAHKTEYKSSPEGYWTWGALVVAAIAYNPTLVSADEAPRTWRDAMDPKWTDTISVKVSISGLQHVTWYVLRQLYGNDFWSKLAPLKPHAFDSYVQQFDRLVSGQDKVALTAQYSGYLAMKAKGAPVVFVYPPDGVVAAPQPWGIVKEAPHPEAARLFMDWFLSVPGQSGNVRELFTYSPRPDVPPPPGGASVTEFKLLIPNDWQAFERTHAQFVREWDKITGLR